MALDGTYAGLQASVADWLKRADLTTNIPDLIVLAEARIARDLRLRAQVITSQLTTTAGVQSVALPSDFLEIENVTVSSVSPPGSMTVVTPEYMDKRFPANYWTDQPSVYCIVAGNMLLGPTPDAAYTIDLTYYQRFPALSVTPTNWLLTNHPSIYLFGTLAEASPFILEDARAPLWEQKYQADVANLQTKDDASVRSGSAMRVRRL